MLFYGYYSFTPATGWALLAVIKEKRGRRVGKKESESHVRKQTMLNFTELIIVFQGIGDYKQYKSWQNKWNSGPVYTGPDNLNLCTDKNLHGSTLSLHETGGTGRIFERLKCTSLGPEKSRSTFWPARFHICTDSCKHPNRATFCSHSAVMAWNQMPQLV